MKEEIKLHFLNQQIQSVREEIEKTSCSSIYTAPIGKSQYSPRIESRYRDYLDGIGESPELDMSDSRIKSMVARIELEQYINEHFVDGIHIYLKDNYGELEAYIMHQIFEPKYGWDMVRCKIDSLYQEIQRAKVITEDLFLKLCNYIPPKTRRIRVTGF